MSLSAVPAPLHHFQLGLPKDKKLLAGAYILLPVQAFDLYNNLITRSLDPYVIEASK